MKLPFPKWLANTEVEVWRSAINSDGDYVESKIYDGKCIYTDKAKSILNADKQLINLSGRVTIEGDISPGEKIEGYVIVSGFKKKIYSFERPLNPDGTVFSTELILS